MRSHSALSILFLAGMCLGESLPKDIFILAGQSNMAGRGGVSRGRWDGRVPLDAAVLHLDARFGWGIARDPLHSDIDCNRTCGVGPGMTFATSVLARDPRIRVVSLVPCAVGGTRIVQWSKGSDLYHHMVVRARAALRDGGRLRAVLWYQGESDTGVRSDAVAYKTNMRKLIGDLRTDLDDPSLLIIQVALASRGGKFVKAVRT
ncbi:hypothetical protein MLD38_034875 [Melastoma candidum]|uniref:Uncharacterized protein n=1 Tax=Melastoma candidum TaxID=119954 RepID=A0ACB9MBF8_9MYRT|nr:hypothetical protein MLD38_034875 [Melastoma candidum]